MMLIQRLGIRFYYVAIYKYSLKHGDGSIAVTRVRQQDIYLEDFRIILRKEIHLMAKVLIINGSPRVGGNTSIALNEMVKVFEAEGVEAEVVQIGNKDI